MSKRLQAGLLGLVLLLGLVVRLYRLADRGIWYDDAFSILLSERPLNLIVQGTAADTMPPLYYFLLHAWLQGGQSIAFIRTLNVVLSCGIILAVYALGSILWGERVGLVASLLIAFSPLQVYHAQEVRMYALLALALVGYTLAFVRLWQADTAGRTDWLAWAGLILAGVIAMYTHNLAIFSLVFPGLFLLLRRAWRLLGLWLAGLMLIGLLSLPWLVLVPGQIAKIQAAFWTPRPGLAEILQALVIFHTNLPLPPLWLGVALFITLASLTLVIFETLRFCPREDKEGLLLTAGLLPPGLMFGASYLMRPIFVPRAFILSQVIYFLFCARVLTHSRRCTPAILLAWLLIGGDLIGLVYQASYAEFPRSPFRAAMQGVHAAYDRAQAVGERLCIVHDNKLSFFPSHIYDRGLPQTFLDDVPGSHNDTYAPATRAAIGLFPQPSIAAATQGCDRVAFVVFDKAIQEYREIGYAEHAVIAWLEDRFVPTSRERYGDLWVLYFSQPIP